MASKTTVAIDQNLRKKLKKLASLLDISQGEVISQAISMFEKSILSQLAEKKSLMNEPQKTEIDVKRILKEATQKVWAQDPERKELQKKLQEGSETIDDFIITNWDSGLE
jgi:predicted transcriptional regulator